MRFRRRLPFAVVAAITLCVWLLSPATHASTAVLPPGRPAAVTATSDDEAVLIRWSPPASDGGAPITGYKVIANTGASVFAPCALCQQVYFSGLQNGATYSFSVYAYNGTFLSALPGISNLASPKATAEAQDSAPEDPTATANGQSVTVRWQPPATTFGLPIDRYLVRAYDLTLSRDSVSKYEVGNEYACGTCTSVSFTGLTNGDSYNFVIFAHNEGPPSGAPSYGQGAQTNAITASDPTCPAGRACVTVNGTSSSGTPLSYSADGFLHSVDFKSAMPSTGGAANQYVGPDWSLVQALSPRWWRVNGCTSPSGFYAPECQWISQNASASETTILSDDYLGGWSSGQAGGAIPPWECWPCYTSAVKTIVSGSTASVLQGSLGQPLPAANVLWDLQNEPPTFGLGPNQGGSASLYLQQLSQAYAALRSVAPSAQIVLPSLYSFVDTPMDWTEGGRNNPHLVGFDSVLPYLVQNSIHPTALSWHEDSGLLAGDPGIVQYQVAQIKYLESEYGLNPSPQIFINEYDPQFANLVPGWSAGWIAALENAEVSQANRGCWTEQTNGSQYDECGTAGVGGTLDGLFTSQYDTQPFSPDANYWVYRFYAQMTGGVVPVTTSTNSLTGLASRDDSTSTLNVLLGRHRSCTPTVNPDCNSTNAPSLFSFPTPSPTGVNVTIDYPYAATSVVASITDIPNVRGAVSQPVPVNETLSVSNGQVTVDLPSVADGDAYTIQLRPGP